jgi:hypothetical protein
MRLVVGLVGLAVSFTVPILAQQKDTIDLVPFCVVCLVYSLARRNPPNVLLVARRNATSDGTPLAFSVWYAR